MKKILVALLLSMHMAYAGEPDELLKRVNDLAEAYLANRVDLETAKELCIKVFQYADAHNIEIWLEKAKGGFRLVDKDICQTDEYGEDAIGRAVMYAMAAADQIRSVEIQPHSESYQLVMEREARNKCHINPDIVKKRYGYDTNSAMAIVNCSHTDRRCVVSIPAINGPKKPMYITACCKIGQIHSDREKTSIDDDDVQTSTEYEAIVGEVSVYWAEMTEIPLTVDNFDYGCELIE